MEDLQLNIESYEGLDSLTDHSNFNYFQYDIYENRPFLPENEEKKLFYLANTHESETFVLKGVQEVKPPGTKKKIKNANNVSTSLKYRNGGRQFGKAILKRLQVQTKVESSFLYYIVNRKIRKSYLASNISQEETLLKVKSVIEMIKIIIKEFKGRNKLQTLVQFREFWGVDDRLLSDRLDSKLAYDCIRKVSINWLKKDAKAYILVSQCKKENIDEMIKLIPKFVEGAKNPSIFTKLT